MQENLVAKAITGKIRDSYEQQFTGFHKLTGHKGDRWYIYYLLGRIIWTQASNHSLRSWRRHISIQSPVLAEQIGQPVSLYYEYWNYAALSRLVKLKQFPRDQFVKIVECYVADALFDILQAGALQYSEFGDLLIEEQRKEAGNMPFLMLENLQSWQQAQHDWQQWEQAGLTHISPNWAPIIKDAEVLKEQTPLQTFQTLNSFANGENTLRDLAIKVKQPIIPIAKSIYPYVSRKLLNFTTIPDIVENGHHGFHLELVEVNQIAESFTSESMVSPTNSEEKVKPEENDVKRALGKEKELGKKDTTEQESVEKPIVEQESLEEGLTAQKAISKESLEEGLTAQKAISKESVGKSLGGESLKKEDAEEEGSPTRLDLAQKQSKQAIELGKAPQPSEEDQTITASQKTNKAKREKRKEKKNNLPKIVYVDDSPADSRAMAAIVEKLGYQYINIPDPLQALPMLIELKPKLIFLDLVMPIANGYEVCAQIRRVSAFAKTPTIIVTSNDGIADRVRTKIVGASGFLGKPIQEKKILKVLKKHLRHEISL